MITSNQTFKESYKPLRYNLERAVDALKRGNNGKHLARFFIKKAEDVYGFLLNASYFDEAAYKQFRSELDALKGLTYYSLRNPSQDAEYAFELIRTKQHMRRIKKSLREPLWVSIGILNGRLKHEIIRNDSNVPNTMVEYRDSAKSLVSDKYKAVVSEINKALRVCGVGKF